MAEMTYVKGLDEMAAKLKALPPRIARNALRRAANAGARVVRIEAKRRAPKSEKPRKRGSGIVTQPGTLKRAAMSFAIRSQSNAVQQTIGVTFSGGKKFQAKGRDAYYFKWVEVGHKIVPRRSKSGVNAGSLRGRRKLAQGSVPGRRFLRDAFNATSTQARDAMLNKLRDDLARLI